MPEGPSEQNPDQDERLSDWVDALMEERERESFVKELEDDPELARELEHLEQTVQVLRRMPGTRAPEDFLEAVQTRIRRRSRGRHFGYQPPKLRFPYEAALNILLLAILVGLYLSTAPPPDPALTPAEAAKKVDGPTDPAIELLADFGVVQTQGDTYTVAIDASRLDELKVKLAKRPDLVLVGEPAHEPGGKVSVRVRRQGGQ